MVAVEPLCVLYGEEPGVAKREMLLRAFGRLGLHLLVSGRLDRTVETPTQAQHNQGRHGGQNETGRSRQIVQGLFRRLGGYRSRYLRSVLNLYSEDRCSKHQTTRTADQHDTATGRKTGQANRSAFTSLCTVNGACAKEDGNRSH